MLNVVYDMMVSVMLETPPGINVVFSCVSGKWERDYEKTNADSGWEECVETHEEYLKSKAYEVFALWEIKYAKKIDSSHWQYFHN